MKRSTVPHPAVILIASLFLSAPGGAAVCSLALHRLGRRKAGGFFAALSALLIIAMAAAVWFINTRWYYIALILASFNLLFGLFCFAFVYKGFSRLQEENKAAGEPKFRGGIKRIIFGVLAGLALGYPTGALFGILYNLLSDSVLSTLLPINPHAFSADEFMMIMIFAMTFVGAVIGGIAGGLIREEDLKMPFKLMVGLVLTSAFLMFMWQFFVDMISFQSYGVSPHRAAPAAGALFPFIFAIFSVIGALILYSAAGLRAYVGKVLLVGYLSLMLALTAVVYTGIISYDFLILGKAAERRADIRPALLLYEKSLNLYPSRYSASYLQFRIGLLLHKIGYDDDAEAAFKNVLTKYTANKEFARNAKLFMDRLGDGSRKGKRVTIPSVEARTEYRSAYCAPNSLALVFNYWNKHTTAKQIGTNITYTFFGTDMIDMFYYAENNDLNFYVRTDAKVSDIKHYIRRKVPVLVFVPQHVFVIFGYDSALDTLVAYDVATYDVWVDHPVSIFEKEWRKRDNQMAVILPRGREAAYMSASERKKAQRVSLGLFQYMLSYAMYSPRDGGNPSEQMKRLERAARLAPEDPSYALSLFSAFPDSRPSFASKYDVPAIEKEAASRIKKAASVSGVEWMDTSKYVGMEAYYRKFKEASQILDYVSSRTDVDTSSSQNNISYITGDYDSVLSSSSIDPELRAKAFEKKGDTNAACDNYLRILKPEEDDDSEDEDSMYDYNDEQSDGYAAYDIPTMRTVFEKIDACPENRKDFGRKVSNATSIYLKSNPYDSRALVRSVEFELKGKNLKTETIDSYRLELFKAATFTDDPALLARISAAQKQLDSIKPKK